MKKIKYILSGTILFLVLMLSLISVSFTVIFQKGDIKLYWSKDKLLTWEDFKGKPIKSSPHAANTDSGFELQYSYKSSDHFLVFELQTKFIKNKSWVKPDKKSEDLLKHEQGHFDISEIYTRKFKKNSIEEKFNEKNFRQKVSEINEKNKNEQNKYQDLYDKETDHSKNEQKQIDWNIKIAKDLKELEKYNESHFTVEVK